MKPSDIYWRNVLLSVAEYLGPMLLLAAIAVLLWAA